jgi:hypothetical protein
VELPPEPPSRPATAGSDWGGPPRGDTFDPPPIAPATQEAAKVDDKGGSGGWLSNLLTRASRGEADDATSNDDRSGPKSSRTAAKDQHSDDNRGPRRGIDSFESLSADIARLIDHEAAADLWERHNRGERNLFTRRLYTMQGRKAFDETRKRYKADREFRHAVDRYVGEFDRMLVEVGHREGGKAVARNYIASEAGKVYTLLAHAAGRFE